MPFAKGNKNPNWKGGVTKSKSNEAYSISKKGRTAGKRAQKKYYNKPGIAEKQKDAYLRRKYGISLARYNNLLSQQKGVCAICSKPESSRKKKGGGYVALSVDHNHKTGEVRGLLCYLCNTTIGLIDEDPDRCDRMKEYILYYKDYRRHDNNSNTTR